MVNSSSTPVKPPELRQPIPAWGHCAIGIGLLAGVVALDAFRTFDRQWSFLYFMVAMYVGWFLRGRRELFLYGAITFSAFLIPILVRPEMRIFNRATGTIGGWIVIAIMRERREFFGKLQQVNDELEIKVAARTSELQAINASLRQEIVKREEAEEWFTRIFQLNPIGICMTSDRDGKVVDVNEAFVTCCGLSREELVGKSTLELGFWNDRAERHEMLQKLRKTGAITNAEFTFRRKDGAVKKTLRSFERLTLHGSEYILSMCNDITERKQVDDELRANRHRLESLSRQLIATQETERSNLARELHDEFGQMLIALKMMLRRVQRTADSVVSGQLDECTDLIYQAMEQVRTLSLNLRPPHLDELGLVATLHWYAKYQANLTGVQIDFAAEPPEILTSTELATVCFRITQEAVTNAIKHVGPRRIEIDLKRYDGELHLLIHNDGQCFDVKTALAKASQGESFGLSSMLERVALAQGKIEIQSSPEHGSTVHAWFRLPSESAREPQDVHSSPG